MEKNNIVDQDKSREFINFYEVINLYVSHPDFQFEPACAPYSIDFVQVLEYVEPHLRDIFFQDEETLHLQEIKAVIGDEDILMKGTVPMFDKSMIIDLGFAIKRHEKLFKDFCKNGLMYRWGAQSHLHEVVYRN